MLRVCWPGLVRLPGSQSRLGEISTDICIQKAPKEQLIPKDSCNMYTESFARDWKAYLLAGFL